MTAFETARIESRVFGRAVDAQTADELLREIENLRQEVHASTDLLNDRWDALTSLIRVAEDVHEDLSAFDLGRCLSFDQHEKFVEPRPRNLIEGITQAKKCK